MVIKHKSFVLLLLCLLTSSAIAADSTVPAAVDATMIQSLVATIRDDRLAKSDPQQVSIAIHRFIELQHEVDIPQPLAESAIGPLIARLDLRDSIPRSRLDYSGPEDVFPAVVALRGIGEHAIPGIVSALASDDRSDSFVAIAVATIYEIQGRHADAVFKVLDAAEKK